MEKESNIEKILIAEEVIKHRIKLLAEKITQDRAGADEDFVIISLMKGAIVFTADLFRELPFELEIELMNVSSYYGGTQSSGEIQFLDEHLPEIAGKQVLVVDDIFDTGLTMIKVTEALSKLGATQVKSCVLLTKDKKREGNYQPDYTGFTIGDEFVVGYGLDYQGRYRNLPYIGVLSL